MRAFLRAVVLALLMAMTAGCAYTWFDHDASSPDPQLNYGGSYRARIAASKGVSQ
jgi:hypothetical protein